MSWPEQEGCVIYSGLSVARYLYRDGLSEAVLSKCSGSRQQLLARRMRQRSGSQALLIIDGRWQLSHLIRSSQYQLKIELKLVILAAETWLKLPIFPPARGFV